MAFSIDFVIDSLKDCLNSLSGNNTLQIDRNLPKKCETCKQAADFFCMRCGVTFYCSKKCQHLNFNMHRYVCSPFLKQPLVKINDNLTKKAVRGLYEQLGLLANTCERLANELEATERYSDLKSDVSDFTATCINGNLDEDVILIQFVAINQVALCNRNCFNDYLKTLKEIDEYGKTASALQKLPQPNAIILTKSGDSFYRVKVISVGKSSKAWYIDKGNFCNIKLSKMFQCPLDIINMKQYITVAYLRNIGPVFVPKEFWQSIKIFEKKTLKLKSYPEFNVVELFDANTGENMNEVIANELKKIDNNNVKSNMQVMEIGKGQQNSIKKEQDLLEKVRVKPIPKDAPSDRKLKRRLWKEDKHDQKSMEKITEELENLTFESAQHVPFNKQIISRTIRNAKAIVVDITFIGRGYMACILMDHLKELQNVQAYLNNVHVTDDKPYKPTKNEYVIAKFDGDWYRGQVINILPEVAKFKISYIDFFNESILSSQDIRRYPMDLKIDCHTQLCFLNGLPKNFSAEIIQFLTNEIHYMDEIVIDRVVDITDDDVIIIDCKQIIERMIDARII